VFVFVCVCKIQFEEGKEETEIFQSDKDKRL